MGIKLFNFPCINLLLMFFFKSIIKWQMIDIQKLIWKATNFDKYLRISLKFIFKQILLSQQQNIMKFTRHFLQFGLMHLTKFKLGPIKKYFQFLQEGFPMQLKVIHVLNAVYFIDKVMALIKAFMKSELINMVRIVKGVIETNVFSKK